MKSIMLIVSALAVANLLALLGFAGWLAGTGRLNGERIEAVRRLLAETPAEQAAREAKAGTEAGEAALIEARLAIEAQTPHTAAEQIRAAEDQDTVRRQRVERLRREVEDLQRMLARGRVELESGWAKLDADRRAFEDMRARIAALEGSEQFEKALRLYESLKPQQTQALLQQLIDQGEIDQAVAYLNAMQTRTASKALAEFKDPAVAADLLERLRTRGLEARGRNQAQRATDAGGGGARRTPDAVSDAPNLAAAALSGG